ncbi:MAG: alpha/beta hydrolase-fold protein [Bacteroidetes bacterium]|nr:alpha/beta hydrolase-fold protein [Bacteroidota bacterium]
MKRLLFFAAFIIIGLTSFCQYNIRLIVTNVATKNTDDIYITGNFNNWNPRDVNYRLKPFAAGRKAIVIKDIPAGTYAFKFTRGSFEKVETEGDGRDIADRVIEVIDKDVTEEITIKGWKDNYPDKPKPYTASPQVKIMDTAFTIPQLDRKRRIWLYLPKGYATSTKTYPVLYMQDGQNLFNEQTAPFGEWGIDEILDSIQKTNGKESIVVGIDNGGDKRLNEYAPYNFESNKKKIESEGKKYVDFIVNTLKPFIDTKYRTKKSVENTFIAGSSMGGVISLYAMMQYPKVFGGVGVFSPAFWTSKELFVEAATYKNPGLFKIYFYCGYKEGKEMIDDMNKMADIFSNKVNIKMYRTTSEFGQHSEKYWHKEFAAFYEWLLKD